MTKRVYFVPTVDLCGVICITGRRADNRGPSARSSCRREAHPHRTELRGIKTN